jgi:HlyD family secretion protein
LANVKLKRWIPRIIAIALIGTGVAWVVIKKPWEKSEPGVTFSTVTVSKGSIAAQVTANGTLSARTTVQVGAQVNGRVVETPPWPKGMADFNDKVKKGQVIAKLDESLLKASLDQEQAAYDLAVANEKKAEVALMDGDRQYKRQLVLQQQNLVAGATVEAAQVTYDSAKASLSASKAAVSQAYANLTQAKANLGYATIYSPIDGVVLTRSYDIGQTVQSSFSAPTLFTIAADLSLMQIDTSVSEGDVGRLQEGMKAQFSVDAFPGKTFEGVVRQVRNSPTTTNGVVTYDAVIDVDNHEGQLRPGMTANCTFVLDQVADAIKIPNAALRFKPSRDQIMALREQFGGGRGSGSGHRGSGSGGHHRGNGSGSGAGSADGSASASAEGSASGGGSGGGMAEMRMGKDGKPDFGDRKPVWKLVDGKPKMVLIKAGLTDGSSTQLVEGDIQPGDLLITEIQGLQSGPTRKVGAF